MKNGNDRQEIVSRIVSHGDAAAFSEVVRRYSSELYSKTLGGGEAHRRGPGRRAASFLQGLSGARHLTRRVPRWSDFPAAGV